MTDVATAQKLGLMEAVIKGRIEASRVHDKVYYTRFVTPAPDAYSRPAMLEVRSKAQLGQRGEEITLRARLGGFAGKAFEVTDKDTGEVRRGVPVRMTLDAVE